MSDEIRKKTYELGYLLLSPDKNSSIVETIEKRGGQITDRKEVSQIRLAYPIKKHSSAYFGVCYFESDSEAPIKIDQDLKLNESVLRFILVLKVVKKKQSVREKERPSRQPEAVVSQPQQQVAVTNEVLEEKLEEILK
jgi:ribosomal protein S6